MTPKISIVIPSYNKVKFIGKTLDSILDQKYSNIEVIIQDGGSTDGTLNIINDYQSNYPKNIKVESKKDGGQFNAVNTGLSKTTGDIVTFINADDCYTDKSFNEIASLYNNNPSALWFAGRGIVVNENDSEIAKLVTVYKNFLLAHSNYGSLLANNYLIQPSVFINSVAYKKYGPFIGTPDFIMEYDLWLRLGKISMPVITKKVLSKFRIEPSTKTKRMFKKLLNEDWKIVNNYTKNPILLFIHWLNNLGRQVVSRFV